MPVDTRNKRASCIGIDGPTRRLLPNPDGTVDQPDRQQLAYKYSGIAAAAPGGFTPFGMWWWERYGELARRGD